MKGLALAAVCLVAGAVLTVPPNAAWAGEPLRAVLVTRLETEPRALAGDRDLVLSRDGWVSVEVRDGRGRTVEPGTAGVRTAWHRVLPDPSAPGGFRDEPITTLDNEWSVRLSDLRRAAGYGDRPGTVRFRIRVTGRGPDGRLLDTASPGGADALRLSFRRDDSYIGWLETYFHVPYKYGSTQDEVRRYLYADCADFVAAGYQKMGGAVLGDMGTATMLGRWRRFFEVVHPEVRRDGRWYVASDTGLPVRIGRGGARPGDILLFKGHTGVLRSDRNRDGRLDVGDRVLHHLYTPPRIDAVPDVWTGPFALIRWRDFTPMQERLKRMGLYTGPLDGIFNAGLEKAFKTFQRRTGLKPDGIPGPETDPLLASRTGMRN